MNFVGLFCGSAPSGAEDVGGFWSGVWPTKKHRHLEGKTVRKVVVPGRGDFVVN